MVGATGVYFLRGETRKQNKEYNIVPGVYLEIQGCSKIKECWVFLLGYNDTNLLVGRSGVRHEDVQWGMVSNCQGVGVVGVGF